MVRGARGRGALVRGRRARAAAEGFGGDEHGAGGRGARQRSLRPRSAPALGDSAPAGTSAAQVVARDRKAAKTKTGSF